MKCLLRELSSWHKQLENQTMSNCMKQDCGLWEAVAKGQYREEDHQRARQSLTVEELSWGGRDWGLGKPRWPEFVGQSTREEGVSTSVSSRELQADIWAFGYKLCTCVGWKKSHQKTVGQIIPGIYTGLRVVHTSTSQSWETSKYTGHWHWIESSAA